MILSLVVFIGAAKGKIGCGFDHSVAGDDALLSVRGGWVGELFGVAGAGLAVLGGGELGLD